MTLLRRSPKPETVEALEADLAAARRTQVHARQRDDLYLELAATQRIDFDLDRLLKLRADSTDLQEA